MKNFLILLFLLFQASQILSQTSFAILPFSKAANVNVNAGPAYESRLYQRLINSGRYRIVDRKQIEQVIKEQNFQLSDLTDQKKIVAVGKLSGAEKLISGNLFMKSETQPAISFSVIDMATAQIELSLEETGNNYSWEDLAQFTSADIIAKYPLMGSILGKAGEIYVIDLGANNGLKNSDRIFVARKSQLIGEKGEVLMEDFNRIGVLEVTKVDQSRSQCKLRNTETGAVVQKGDLVSPDPIPTKPAEVSTTPLLPGIKNGSLILDDTMDKKYLAPSNSPGDQYKSGKLYIDSRNNTSVWAYGFYPPPYDKLNDFIVEGEITFEKNQTFYNKFSLSFRSDGKYPDTGYSFFMNNKGSYQVNIYRSGQIFNILPLTSTPLLNRDEAKNKFKIVAVGSSMDFYINDQFLVGLKDELFERGTIGFTVSSGGFVSIDNVKIWELKK